MLFLSDEAGQESIGRFDVRDAGTAEFDDQAALERLPEAFHTPLGLGRKGGGYVRC